LNAFLSCGASAAVLWKSGQKGIKNWVSIDFFRGSAKGTPWTRSQFGWSLLPNSEQVESIMAMHLELEHNPDRCTKLGLRLIVTSRPQRKVTDCVDVANLSEKWHLFVSVSCGPAWNQDSWRTWWHEQLKYGDSTTTRSLALKNGKSFSSSFWKLTRGDCTKDLRNLRSKMNFLGKQCFSDFPTKDLSQLIRKKWWFGCCRCDIPLKEGSWYQWLLFRNWRKTRERKSEVVGM
jgi:hypothetical protein